MKLLKSLGGGRRWILAAGLALLHAILATFTQAGAAEPLQEGAEKISGILVVPRYEDVNRAGVTGISGVVVKGPDFLQRPDFQELLAGNLGAPLTSESLSVMQTNIVIYCRAHGHLVVDVFFRPQEILEGTIQIAVIEGKVGRVSVENEGHKWFSDSLVLGRVRLRPGDVVLENRLNSDVISLNRNSYQSLGQFDGSFREVTTSFQQGKLGETDVKLTVEDRFPLRGYAGLDDSGIELVGDYRVFAGFNYANVFGLDHRLNYQYTADTHFDRFKAHAASYVIPLPWRHDLVLFGAYADVNPDYAVIGAPGFSSKGEVYQLSGRYSIPLPRLQNYDHEITAGFDFKHTDTPTLFGSTEVFATNPVEVAQFTLEYRGLLSDRWGGTSFSLQGVYSPGDLTSLNTDADFEEFAPGTSATYVYGRVEVRRETMLPAKFSWHLRGLGQISDSKLTPSETFGVGGYTSVRGYDERTVIGDNGWLLVNELRSPRIPLGNATGREKGVGWEGDWLQVIGFCDYGGNINLNRQVNVQDPTLSDRYGEVLLSVGGGLRYQMAENLRVRFDYGHQLAREYLTDPKALPQSKGRVHLGVELSF